VAADRFAAAGVEVVDLVLPDDFAPLADLHSLIMRAEGRAAFLADYVTDYARLDQSFRDQVENVDGYTPPALVAALDLAARCRPAFDRLAAQFDAVLTSSAPGEAPAGLAATGTALFNRMWTLLHVPCVNLPGLVGPAGLPVGVTLTAPRFADRRLLAAAARLAPLLAADLEDAA
jgi:Asp-tRNA(Asn)/Glu-tRNA(Gln) amidotransferase A subunit family amidase